ncbi:MAG: glycosyltransferase [Bacteroidetes bacterium CHB5]|nr:glycosyltransferase [Bacteroidetes bacterium CHB5]
MYFIEYIIYFYLALAVLYSVILSVAGHLYKVPAKIKNPVLKKFAVFVPGYKEDSVIFHVAQQLTKLEYPKDLFDIVVIADSFQPETLQKLSTLPIILLEPKFDKSSKAKSLNFAFSSLPEKYDNVVILDADNVVHVDFLTQLNYYLQGEVRAIQTQRVAKNTDTSFSLLDACSEAINNHIFRKGHNAIGLSSSLIGSGMAFQYTLLKDIISKIESVYEDREIQFELAKRNIKILYIEGILVYDEKIDNPAAFQNQRRRWLYAQVMSFIDYFGLGHRMLLKGNLSFYNFTVLNNLFPPRLILLGLLFIIPVISTGFRSNHSIYWWPLTALYVICLLISIPRKLYSKKLIIALFSIPLAFIKMIQAFFRMKGANKFIHTTHTKTGVDSVFQNDEPR